MAAHSYFSFWDGGWGEGGGPRAGGEGWLGFYFTLIDGSGSGQGPPLTRQALAAAGNIKGGLDPRRNRAGWVLVHLPRVGILFLHLPGTCRTDAALST